MKLLLLLSLFVQAQEAPEAPKVEPPKASDCDFKSPGVRGIMGRATIQNRLRPGNWAHWKTADGGEIVCVYKDKYLKTHAPLKAVDASSDDLVLSDSDGDAYHILKSRLLLGSPFAQEQDAASQAWLIASTAHEIREFSLALSKYGDSKEDQDAAEDRALEVFLAADGADAFRGDGKGAKKRRECLKSYIEENAKRGVNLYPTGSPSDHSAFADSPGAKGGARVVEVNGALMVKTGADDFRPCP